MAFEIEMLYQQELAELDYQDRYMEDVIDKLSDSIQATGSKEMLDTMWEMIDQHNSIKSRMAVVKIILEKEMNNTIPRYQF
jgi:hypothetical protein